jgi:Protein of unknown function (DUF2914)
MNKLLTILAALVVAPAYATGEYSAPAQPAAAAQPTGQPATAAQPIAKPKPTGTVARAQFTNAIQDREPVDKVGKLLTDKNEVYFFSEIRGAANQKVTHRWEHNGKVWFEKNFDIGGDRWRVFSNKNLDPSMTGEWKVSVVDEAGSTLGASTFTYENAPPPAPAATTPATGAAPAAAPAAASQKP